MATESTNTETKSGGSRMIAFVLIGLAVLAFIAGYLDDYEGSLSIHPMDQFEVQPFFGAGEAELSIAPGGEGEAGLATYRGETLPVQLTAVELGALQDGETVSRSAEGAGFGTVGLFTITNVTFWMAMAVLAVILLMVVGTRGRAVVPSRSQSMAELAYSFVRQMVEDVAGKDALPYFPYIFTLFLYILFANFLGLIPGSFTTTSHIAVTAVMAFAVFFTVTIVGFVKNGAGFLSLFWVTSAPLAIRPVLAIIEFISYMVRPISHSLRLAGSMMAGHAVLKVFAGFVGALGLAGVAPIVGVVAIYALEFLVSGIQAYVFTILTCVYLKDALHPNH